MDLDFFATFSANSVRDFVVHHRLGAVDVLGLRVIQHAAAKGDDSPAHIDDGYHDAVAEDIVEIALGAALDKAGSVRVRFSEKPRCFK